MRPLALAALGIVAYAVFLTATVPARLVAAAVERETRGALRLAGAEGTLWRGTARGAITLPSGAADLDELRWRWLPASLAAGRLGFDVRAATAANLTAAGEVARTWAGWEARELRVQGPAQGASGLSPLFGAWRPDGMIDLHVPRLAWAPASIDGSARLEWRGAALALSDVKPLGTYRAELRGEGAEARIALSTLDGPLRLSGGGTLNPQGRLAFKGEARAEGPQAAALESLLDLLGPRQPDGSRLLGLRY